MTGLFTKKSTQIGKRTTVSRVVLAGVLLHLTSAAHFSMRAATPHSDLKETSLKNHARGTFDVALKPHKPDGQQAASANLARMSIEKQFHGPLEALSRGEMLSVTTDVKGSAGYVALERVTGTLNGHTGSFVLQHSGTMTRGVPQLIITVVPDSATGQLVGLAGTMTISDQAGKHFYDFEYTLPEN